MLKKLRFTLGAAVILILSIVVGAHAASNIQLIVNGKSIPAEVMIIDDSSYVPLRIISEALGAEVNWDDNTRTIAITEAGKATNESLQPPAQTQAQTPAPATNQPIQTGVHVNAPGGQYSGTIKSGKNFKFTLSEDGRQITELSADVLEYPSGSLYSSWTTIYFDGPFAVKEDGSVSVEGKETHDGVTVTYTLSAQFDSDGNATGTIDQSSIVAGAVYRTYKLDWTAQRQ